jgi:hypothetical protein
MVAEGIVLEGVAIGIDLEGTAAVGTGPGDTALAVVVGTGLVDLDKVAVVAVGSLRLAGGILPGTLQGMVGTLESRSGMGKEGIEQDWKERRIAEEDTAPAEVGIARPVAAVGTALVAGTGRVRQAVDIGPVQRPVARIQVFLGTDGIALLGWVQIARKACSNPRVSRRIIEEPAGIPSTARYCAFPGGSGRR